MPDKARVQVESTLHDLDTRIAKLEQAHARKDERATSAFAGFKDLGEFAPAADGGLPILPEAPFENLIILGYKDDVFFSINRNEGSVQAYQDVDVAIPTEPRTWLRSCVAGRWLSASRRSTGTRRRSSTSPTITSDWPR
jgi:hypothetical protein